MQTAKCPKCGHETADCACPACGQATANGATKPHWVKPPPPPELAGMVFTPTPPEMTEEFLQTFNEAEFLAEMQKTLETGSADIDALISELERKVNGSTGSDHPLPSSLFRSR